jgi:polyisoprenoid-binding protein YceI
MVCRAQWEGGTRSGKLAKSLGGGSIEATNKELSMRFFLGFSAVLGLSLCGCTPTEVAQSGGNNSSVVTEGGEAETSTPGISGEMTEGAAPTGEVSSGLSPADGVIAPAESTTEPAPAAGEAPAAAESTARAAAELTPVKIEDGAATLSPDNTKIEFVGTHSPPKPPDPRVGVFQKFSGAAKVDADAKELQSVSVEIGTASLKTQFPKLTTHLQSADFFDVREYPTAKFESTEIAPGDDGLVTIKGNLTLHGETKEISIPAAVSITDEGLTLRSNFSINGSEFGIKFDGVEDKISLSVAIGEKTATP